MYNIFKLFNGDEVIGKIKGESDHFVTVEEPFIIMYDYDDTGKNSHVTMSKYMPFGETNTITIRKTHITSLQRPSKDAAEYYQTCKKMFEAADDTGQDSMTKEEYQEYVKMFNASKTPGANTSIH